MACMKQAVQAAPLKVVGKQTGTCSSAPLPTPCGATQKPTPCTLCRAPPKIIDKPAPKEPEPKPVFDVQSPPVKSECKSPVPPPGDRPEQKGNACAGCTHLHPDFTHIAVCGTEQNKVTIDMPYSEAKRIHVKESSTIVENREFQDCVP